MNQEAYNWKSTGPGGCDSHCIEHPCGPCITGRRSPEKMIESEASEKPIMPEKIGVSSITLACESLKHYHWAKVLGRRDETPALIEGIQLHMLILEPAKFYASYCTDLDIPRDKRILKTVEDLKEFLIEEGFSPRGKKAELVDIARKIIGYEQDNDVIIYDDWVEEQTRDKEFITKAKWTMLHEMRASVQNHAFALKYLSNPYAKMEVEIEGELDGQAIRGRADWIIDDPALSYVVVVDVKKTKSAKFHKFRQSINDLWYFVQAALYSHMIEKKYNKPCLYVWIACEGTWPFIVEAWSANDPMLEAGMKHARDALKRLKHAFETNHWPGYTSGLVNNIDLSNFAYDRAEELEDDDDGQL